MVALSMLNNKRDALNGGRVMSDGGDRRRGWWERTFGSKSTDGSGSNPAIWLIVPVLVIALVGMKSCGGDTEPQPVQTQPPVEPVKPVGVQAAAPAVAPVEALPNVPQKVDHLGRKVLFLSAELIGDGRRPAFSGVTNLPDGTELMLTVRSDQIAFLAQDKVVVAGRRFKSQTFSNRGGSFLPGTYQVELSSPISGVQPPSVQSVVGKEYENFVGPQFSEDGIGRRLSTSFDFTVAGDLTPQAIASSKRATAEDTRSSILESCRYIEERAGRPTKTDTAIGKIEQCADDIQRQAAQQELSKAAEE